MIQESYLYYRRCKEKEKNPLKILNYGIIKKREKECQVFGAQLMRPLSLPGPTFVLNGPKSASGILIQ